MKTISILLVLGALSLVPATSAQDAAVEERLNKLTGYIQDLQASQEVQQKRTANLAKDIEALREQASKPAGNFASQEDLKKLADKLQEIDQKRIADNEKILAAIDKLIKAGAKPPKERERAETSHSSPSTSPEKGFEYVIQEGDTLSAIAQAYRNKGVKVYPDQILKANPGVKATALQPGQKIFIPAP